MLITKKLTESHVALLREKRIFFETSTASHRLRPGDTLVFDDAVQVEPYCAILSGGNVVAIGAFSYSWSPLPHGMTIGRYCSIAGGMAVPGPRHPVEAVSTSSFVYDSHFCIFSTHVADRGQAYTNRIAVPQKPAPTIGNDVWIGTNCAIMPGVSIGDGAVVAANSVVTRNVDPYTIVGGNPAKPIRPRFHPRIAGKLLMARWWEYSFVDFQDLPLRDPEAAADMILDGRLAVPRYEPARILLKDVLQ